MFFALCSSAEAQQQPKKIPRIGILRAGSAPDPFVEAFRQDLRDLGYVEGKSTTIEHRWAEGKNERLPDLAADLVRLKVDVILAAGPGPSLAAKQATSTIPIVAPAVVDPVGSRLVASLARPGGNLTGLGALRIGSGPADENSPHRAPVGRCRIRAARGGRERISSRASGNGIHRRRKHRGSSPLCRRKGGTSIRAGGRLGARQGSRGPHPGHPTALGKV